MIKEKIKRLLDDMKDTKEKQLLMVLFEDAMPFMRVCDGVAVKMDEDKEIEYTDWEGNTNVLKIPAGSYVSADWTDLTYPKIIPAEEFEGKNKFLAKDEKPKKNKKPEMRMGMNLMSDMAGGADYAADKLPKMKGGMDYE